MDEAAWRGSGQLGGWTTNGRRLFDGRRASHARMPSCIFYHIAAARATAKNQLAATLQRAT